MLKLPQNLVTLVLGILVINVIGLWTVYLISRPKYQAAPATTASPSASPQAEGIDLVATDAKQLQELKVQLDDLAESVATFSTQPSTVTKTITQTISTPSAKEYVIYLGSGSTISREWVEIEGTKTTINTANYPQIKNMEFQALLSNANGEARARLKNKTTGAIYHDSEVMHGSSTASWVSKTDLLLHAGNNEYIVELKSTSGEMAQLEGARVRISVE